MLDWRGGSRESTGERRPGRRLSPTEPEVPCPRPGLPPLRPGQEEGHPGAGPRPGSPSARPPERARRTSPGKGCSSPQGEPHPPQSSWHRWRGTAGSAASIRGGDGQDFRDPQVAVPSPAPPPSSPAGGWGRTQGAAARPHTGWSPAPAGQRSALSQARLATAGREGRRAAGAQAGPQPSPTSREQLSWRETSVSSASTSEQMPQPSPSKATLLAITKLRQTGWAGQATAAQA